MFSYLLPLVNELERLDRVAQTGGAADEDIGDEQNEGEGGAHNEDGGDEHHDGEGGAQNNGEGGEQNDGEGGEQNEEGGDEQNDGEGGEQNEEGGGEQNEEGGDEQNNGEGGEQNDGEKVTVESCYRVVETRRRQIPRYRSEANEHVVRFDGERIGRLVNQEEDIVNVFHAVFESLLERFVEGFAAQDRVGFEIHAPSLDHPIWIQLMRRDQVSVQRILQAIFRVLQSKTAFVLDGDVEIRVLHIEMPHGSGRSNIRSWVNNKRSIISISSKDHLCLARALVTAKARIDKDTDPTVELEQHPTR